MATRKQSYDRPGQDVGNVVAFEHLNVQVPSQELATRFYVIGLGLTRDPHMMVGTDNMWVNVGRQQFHLPTGPAQRFRGTVGLLVPDREALIERLERVAPELEGTEFSFRPRAGHVEVTGPWGNTFRVHAADPAFPGLLGMPYLEIKIAAGAAPTVARFYQDCLGAGVTLETSKRGAAAARVRVGPGQQLIYRPARARPGEYDGHHVAIYVTDFSGPYDWLRERGLVSREDSDHQYRFRLLGDAGEPVWELEHEVRSLLHPLWQRPLVNREHRPQLPSIRTGVR